VLKIQKKGIDSHQGKPYIVWKIYLVFSFGCSIADIQDNLLPTYKKLIFTSTAQKGPLFPNKVMEKE